VQKQPHQWTTLDLAPTILEAIGIKAPKFGLGRSLWQKEPTLIEKYGNKLDWEFYKSSDFYKKLNVKQVTIKNFEKLPLNVKIKESNLKKYATISIISEDLVGDPLYADELNFKIATKKNVCINMKFLAMAAKNHKDTILINNKKVAEWSLTKDEKTPFERTICLKQRDLPANGEIVLKIDRKMQCDIFTCGYGWREIEVVEQPD
jgi:hypothetical protein